MLVNTGSAKKYQKVQQILFNVTHLISNFAQSINIFKFDF